MTIFRFKFRTAFLKLLMMLSVCLWVSACNQLEADATKALEQKLGVTSPDIRFTLKSDQRVCGELTSLDEKPKKFIYEAKTKIVEIEPEVPSFSELSSADTNCALSVPPFTSGTGCSGIEQATQRFEAATDFLVQYRKACVQASPNGAKQ